jgi:hypothetical protein
VTTRPITREGAIALLRSRIAARTHWILPTATPEGLRLAGRIAAEFFEGREFPAVLLTLPAGRAAVFLADKRHATAEDLAELLGLPIRDADVLMLDGEPAWLLGFVARELDPGPHVPPRSRFG